MFGDLSVGHRGLLPQLAQVVLPPEPWVAENVVRLVDLLELGHGVRIARVQVGVVLLGQFQVGISDLFGGGSAGQAQVCVQALVLAGGLAAGGITTDGTQAGGSGGPQDQVLQGIPEVWPDGAHGEGRHLHDLVHLISFTDSHFKKSFLFVIIPGAFPLLQYHPYLGYLKVVNLFE